MSRPTPTVAAYRALHQSGCFVLPNPWDVGSAMYLHRAGFRALATTSAGMAFARGLPDDPNAIPVEVMLQHLREMAAATPLPVNADFQSGYGKDAAGVAANVRAAVATGVAGLSIEDATGDAAQPLFARDEAIARLRAARAAIDESGTEVVLTARCEAYLVGDPEAERTVLDRLAAFAEAGADCLYAPGVKDEAMIAKIVRAVAPKPVNVLVSSPGMTVARLTELGVRRISVGSALSRAAWGGFIRATRTIIEHGTFDGFADAASFAELRDLFGGKQ
ncbi:MAG TPA: isocitrate lyase/phosphoenolpyruvate mutase family protein [Polyangia bacterium]|nr:isocitrate lyase/phosphoenolpyruvate mutase family protein [Polyangia bacterium]